MNAATYRKPLPAMNDVTRGFWELAREEKLAVQRCLRCGDRHFPPAPVCPACLADDQQWEVVSGRGTLLSWVTFHRAYWDGFAPDLPYDVCLVALDEGPMLVSNLVETAGATVAVGNRVEVVFERVTDDVTLPKFRLARPRGTR